MPGISRAWQGVRCMWQTHWAGYLKHRKESLRSGRLYVIHGGRSAGEACLGDYCRVHDHKIPEAVTEPQAGCDPWTSCRACENLPLLRAVRQDLQYPEWQDWNPAVLRFHTLYKADGGAEPKILGKGLQNLWLWGRTEKIRTIKGHLCIIRTPFSICVYII